MKVVWTDTAKGNLRTIQRYIAQNSPAYANRMIDSAANRLGHIRYQDELFPNLILVKSVKYSKVLIASFTTSDLT